MLGYSGLVIGTDSCGVGIVFGEGIQSFVLSGFCSGGISFLEGTFIIRAAFVAC